MIFRHFAKHFSKKLQLIHIGGLAEIGRNMTLLRYGNNILIIDCGIKFPGDDMPGIDKIIPDMSYLVKNKNLVRALVLTHGHEDHIGAIPYLLRDINIPIYGTKLTLGILESKLREARLFKEAKLHVVKPRDVVNIGPFEVEFLRVCHSIADAVALSIKTPVGNIIHTGDFKIDNTPIDGEKIDLVRFGELGSKGVILMLSDSTNADIEGSTPSEKVVGEMLCKAFDRAKGRIIVAMFASNVNRMQQILDCAEKYGRKVAISGRSMQSVSNKAKELGYLKVPKDILFKLDDISKLPHGKLVILTTGSQGEPMAALSRMAKGEHKQVKIHKDDTVIISALPIPGNETSVHRTIDSIFKLGGDVVYEERHGLHVSGHGCQEDMKLLLNLVKPKYFVPVHGEYRHLVAHAKVAKEVGIKQENIFLNMNGDILSVSKDRVSKSQSTPIKEVFLDGLGVGDITPATLAERRQLSDDGIIIVDVVVSRTNFKQVRPIEIETRGFVFAGASHDLAQKSKEIVHTVIAGHHKHRFRDTAAIKQEIQKKLGKFLSKETQRCPIIVSIITQI